MIRPGLCHGFSQTDWDAAKGEARALMINRARRRSGGTISYSELVQGIRSISLEPHDTRLDHFLGEIASEEDAAGRGMLTVLVVHKTGDQMPGQGFFDLAEERGYDVSDREMFWVDEMRRVLDFWKNEQGDGA